MTARDPERLRSVALEAAREGGAVGLKHFRTDLEVAEKQWKMDAVTVADTRAQERVLSVIGDAYPNDVVVGEEDDAPKRVPEEGPAWVVDPIDGTVNYTRDMRLWACVVAYVEDGDPLAAATVLPATGDEYVAGPEGTGPPTRDGEAFTVSDRSDPELMAIAPIFGIQREHREDFAEATRTIVTEYGDMRRFGSGQISLAGVAAGELDAAVSTIDLSPWDTVAGVHLIRRAGGTVTDLNGDRWKPHSETLVVSNGERHEALLESFDGFV